MSSYATPIARNYYRLDIVTGTPEQADIDDERFDVGCMVLFARKR